MAQEPYLVSLRRLIDEEQADCAFYHLAAQSSQGTPSAPGAIHKGIGSD